MVQLHLVRDFELLFDDEPSEVAPTGQRLLSFLALRQRPVRRAFVSGTLWGDSDERHARASLRTALWRIRSLDLVHTSPTHLWLAPDVCVDVSQLMQEATAVCRSDASEARLLEVARDLIDAGDDLLAGWYEDWVLGERESFRQIRLQALDHLGEALVECGRLFEAMRVGVAAVAADPLRESPRRILVQVHLRQGNVAEAIRQYRAYRSLLGNELLGEPSPALTELVAPHLGGLQLR